MSSLSWTLMRGLASRSLGRRPWARTDPARTKSPLIRAKSTSQARLVCPCAPLMTASVTRHETLIGLTDGKCADCPGKGDRNSNYNRDRCLRSRRSWLCKVVSETNHPGSGLEFVQSRDDSG